MQKMEIVPLTQRIYQTLTRTYVCFLSASKIPYCFKHLFKHLQTKIPYSAITLIMTALLSVFTIPTKSLGTLAHYAFEAYSKLEEHSESADLRRGHHTFLVISTSLTKNILKMESVVMATE